MSQEQQLPEIRQTPTWDASDKLELYGYEFEQIFNFINAVGPAYMAANSILNRNVLNGKVRMKFEKLVGEDYQPMTEAESKPYNDKFQETIAEAKRLAEEATGLKEVTSQSQEGVERLDAIVDQHGVPVNTEERGTMRIVK